MSGGSLNYFYSDLRSHVGDFKDKELDDLIKDLSNLFYEREWFTSGDTCEGRWVEARNTFKAKWFTAYGRRERIEQYLDEIKSEMLKSLDLSDQYCGNCRYWHLKSKSDLPYGVCDRIKSCLMHRSECCENFERAEEGENEGRK